MSRLDIYFLRVSYTNLGNRNGYHTVLEHCLSTSDANGYIDFSYKNTTLTNKNTPALFICPENMGTINLSIMYLCVNGTGTWKARAMDMYGSQPMSNAKIPVMYIAFTNIT